MSKASTTETENDSLTPRSLVTTRKTKVASSGSSRQQMEADIVSLSSAGSSGGPAPLPASDEAAPLVAPMLIVANICTNLASMTGAIMCWYFAAHSQIWGTGFFEGALNIGASMAVLGILLCKGLPTYAKVICSLLIFSLGIFADVAVVLRTSSNLYLDLEEYTISMHSIKDLILKVLGHALTIFGAATSGLCLLALAIRGVLGAFRSHQDPDLEFNSSALGPPYRSKRSAGSLGKHGQQQLKQQGSNSLSLPAKRRLYKQRYEGRRSISIENAVLEHEPPVPPVEPKLSSSTGHLVDEYVEVNEQGNNQDENDNVFKEGDEDESPTDSIEEAYLEEHRKANDKFQRKHVTENSDEKCNLLAKQLQPNHFSPPSIVISNTVGDSTVVSGDDNILIDFSRQRTRADSVQKYLKKQAAAAASKAASGEEQPKPP